MKFKDEEIFHDNCVKFPISSITTNKHKGAPYAPYVMQ